MVPNWDRSMSRLYIVTLLIYMQSTSCEMPGWMKLKMESKWQGEISIILDMQMITTLMADSKELKSLLSVKEESEKVGLKLNIQKTNIMASGPIASWQKRWGNNGNSDRLYFFWLQNHCRW